MKQNFYLMLGGPKDGTLQRVDPKHSTVRFMEMPEFDLNAYSPNNANYDQNSLQVGKEYLYVKETLVDKDRVKHFVYVHEIDNVVVALIEKAAEPKNDYYDLLCELYYILNTLEAGEHVLKNVVAAIRNKPLPYKTLLPYFKGIIDR